MNIEQRSLTDIRPYERNPRINDKAIASVAASIEQYGFRQPIVVDSDGVIVVGHTRWKAAQRLGLTEVPVHVATELTPEQARAYRIADNKTGELAEWNLELLPAELAELQALDVDLGSLGFGTDELASLLDPGVGEGLTDLDQIPEPPDEATTQPGDLWVMRSENGVEHRLMCGDSGSVEDLDRLLSGAGIQLVNTDPPYNVKVEPRSNNAIAAGNSSFPESKRSHHQSFDVARQGEKPATSKKLRAKDRPLMNDFVTDEQFDQMLASWFGNIARVLEPGRS
ncbi:MAG: ParB N-terminal domain-containing protein, partial [Phycisphaerae bacterium]